MPIGHWSIDNCNYYLFILQVKLNSLIYLVEIFCRKILGAPGLVDCARRDFARDLSVSFGSVLKCLEILYFLFL